MRRRSISLGAAASLLLAAISAARAETGTCAAATDRTPVRLWSAGVADSQWTKILLSHVVVTDGGAVVAFGIGERAGDSRRLRLVMAAVPGDGAGAPIPPMDLSPHVDAAPETSAWIAAALALPGGDVVAVAVADRGRTTTHRLLRFAPDGRLLAHRDVAALDGPFEQVRMVRDGKDRFAILGAAGSPPTVNGIFQSFDLALRPIAAYSYPHASSAIYQFTRQDDGAYVLLGDLSGTSAEAEAGRFRVVLGRDGRAAAPRRLGPPLQFWHPNGISFDLRGGTALLAVPGTDFKRIELLWIAGEATIRERRPVPDWELGGDSFLATPRLDEAGCALVFGNAAGSGRVMRIDRTGAPLWRLVLRAEEGGEVDDLAPLPHGGFVAVGQAARGRWGPATGWIERYGHR